MNRLFNYSPVLLSLPDFGLRVRDASTIGFGIAFLFLATLPFLFRPASLHALVLACAACLSTGGPIALERGNFDLPEFVLIAAAGLFALRLGVTCFASYAIFLIIGLLKFYPHVLLALSVRERPRAFAAIAALSAAVLFAFCGYYWSDLQKFCRTATSFHLLGRHVYREAVVLWYCKLFPSLH